MRIILKIILFPITLALSIIVLLLNFLITYGGALTNILAGLFFTLGVVFVGARIFGWTNAGTSPWGVVLIPFVVAFLLSPFGLVGLVGLIADGLDSFNGLLKSI